MTRALAAECTAGVVTVDGLPVPGAVILSGGVGSSSGVLLLTGDEAIYIASISSDLETALEKVISALGQLGTTLTSIGAGMTGPTTAPPPTLAADVVQFATIQAQLTALKEALK